MVAGSPTVGFAVRRPLDCDRAQPIAWNFTRWSAEEVISAWRRSAEPLPPEARARLWVGAALLFESRRETKQACEILRDVARDPALRPHLESHAARRLQTAYPVLFRAAGLEPPPGPRRPGGGVKPALRRAGALGRRLLSRIGGRSG